MSFKIPNIIMSLSEWLLWVIIENCSIYILHFPSQHHLSWSAPILHGSSKTLLKRKKKKNQENAITLFKHDKRKHKQHGPYPSLFCGLWLHSSFCFPSLLNLLLFPTHILYYFSTNFCTIRESLINKIQPISKLTRNLFKSTYQLKIKWSFFFLFCCYGNEVMTSITFRC